MTANKLRWRRAAFWNLGRGEQVVWVADGRDVQYKISRAGTADKPSWRLYTRREDGTEEQWLTSNRLGDAKSYAVSMEARVSA